jgi:hypothetical protein
MTPLPRDSPYFHQIRLDFSLSKICENIRKSRFTADVVDAGGQLSNSVVNTGGKCATGANDAGKFALASRMPSIQKIAAGDNDSSGQK